MTGVSKIRVVFRVGCEEGSGFGINGFLFQGATAVIRLCVSGYGLGR